MLRQDTAGQYDVVLQEGNTARVVLHIQFPIQELNGVGVKRRYSGRDSGFF